MIISIVVRLNGITVITLTSPTCYCNVLLWFLTIPEAAAHMSLDYFYLQSNLQTLTKYLFYAFMDPYLPPLKIFKMGYVMVNRPFYEYFTLISPIDHLDITINAPTSLY